MNMILHNITRFTIENGDTLEDPLILDNGQIRKFDRVLANPPFSQNYSRANMKFTSRFREWCPETGKKADLMFVQHMLASLKPNGHMATIMPHGVLFRGGKEKLIRELFINDDCIEAIISLPPGLFYGTGIPACVLVCNKSKPDALRDKVLFINADREYAEGKNQNKLRPEDIEKIDFVFTHKREIPKYSRLVDKSEIVEQPRLQPQHPPLRGQHARPRAGGRAGPPDRRHPRGGGRRARRRLRQVRRQPGFAVPSPSGPATSPFASPSTPSPPSRPRSKPIRPCRTPSPATTTPSKPGGPSPATTSPSSARGNGGKKMPEVRHELLTTLKAKLIPLGVLDEFKSAGVFVNWWQQIRYDLKTIVSTGWHHSLIPDDYLIAEFFQAEADEIEALEATIARPRANWPRPSRPPRRSAGYEPDEDEKVTAAVIKKALKALIDDLKDSAGDPPRRNSRTSQDQDKAIKAIEKRIKDAKADTQGEDRRAGAEARNSSASAATTSRPRTRN